MTVKLIPRLDLAHLKGGADDDTKPKRQRPPQKFFNPEEIRNLGLGIPLYLLSVSLSLSFSLCIIP